MSTLSEDLELMAVGLRSITQHPVEVRDNSVYVDFGYHEAVVIEQELTERGKVWHIEALAWDQTGGVSAEHYIGSTVFTNVRPLVQVFLNERDHENAELERLLAEMPEDI